VTLFTSQSVAHLIPRSRVQGCTPVSAIERPAAPKPRRARSTGKVLEALILNSRSGYGVELEHVPNGVQFIGGGKTIPKKSPVDFGGSVVGTGRAVWLDAKECHKAGSFDASDDKLKRHQVDLLIRQGRAGAIAGLLIRCSTTERLHWLDWRLLVDRRPTYPWGELPDVGDAKAYRVDWAAVSRAVAALEGAVRK
jgi:hypothetical protein